MSKRVAGENPAGEARSGLDELVREGATRMLAAALEVEVVAFLELHEGVRDAKRRRQVVRNGYLPERTILTGAGALPVQQPRARDKRGTQDPEAVTFTSAILPRYLRKSEQMADLIPWLYLRGVSTGDFGEALGVLVGPGAAGLSASSVTRLLATWTDEHEAWAKRDLSGKQYAYLWADGVYFNVRLEGERQCILVLMGATREGKKELVALLDGQRESEQSWYEVLVDLKQRGLSMAPKLAVGDGALGFWSALSKVYPETRQQRCWVHKTSNVLNKLPKAVQPRAKADLHQIWMADTKDEALKAFDNFVAKYKPKYPKAVECLTKDKEELLSFYDLPAEHWLHLRTTNPIESTFATVRHRHDRTKGSATRRACLAMVFKLALLAQAGWRRLNGHEQIVRLLEGNRFVNGVLQERDAA